MTYFQKQYRENNSCGDISECGQLTRSGKEKQAMISGLSDAELVNRIKETKDHAAFETLFNTYSQRLQRRVIWRFGCSLADAEDAAQHAFICLWRGTSLKGESLMPLLARYADNYLVDEWRRRKRLPSISLTHDPNSDTPPLDFPDRIPEKPDPILEMAGKIPDALNVIPGTYSEAIKLYYLEGKKLTEAGEIIQRDQSTVSRRLSMGIRKLKTVLLSSEPAQKKTYQACVTIDHKLATIQNIANISERVERLRGRGMSWRDVARLVGVSDSQIYYRFKRKPVASVGISGNKQKA